MRSGFFLLVSVLMSVAGAGGASAEGAVRALVLFVHFSADGETGPRPAPEWSAGLFEAERPGSLRHFYDAMSGGGLQLDGLAHPRQFAAAEPAAAYLAAAATETGGYGRLVLEVLEQADAEIDFSLFDNDGPDGVPASGDDDGAVDLLFVVLDRVPARLLRGGATGIAGLGLSEPYSSGDLGADGAAIRVHGHRGTVQLGRSFAETVGHIAHEYGHILGLPDLYDTDYLARDGAPPAEDSAGIGAWGLMGWGALGWNGDGPAPFSGWSLAELGWAAVDELQEEEKEVRLLPPQRGGRLLKVPLGNREYFLLEYRRRDAGYYYRNDPGEGLLVWHVYWKAPNTALELPGRVGVRLVGADGRWADAAFPLGHEAAPVDGGDNLDFWAHDTGYARLHGGNLGDATDPFDGVRYTAFTPDTNPAALGRDGAARAWISDIRREGDAMRARVRVQPLIVRLSRFEVDDEDGDSVAVAGEDLTLRVEAHNSGGLPAEDVRVRVRDAPGIEVRRAEAGFGRIEVGRKNFGVRSGGFPVVRVAGDFVGSRRVEAVLDIEAGGRVIGADTLVFDVLSPRQPLAVWAVADTLGNGDGQVQPGEFFRLDLGLEAPSAAAARAFRYSLKPLDDGLRRLGDGRLFFHGDDGRFLGGPEFLAAGAGGVRAALQLEVRSEFGAWLDTLDLDIVAGADSTPPRLGAVAQRPVDGGVLLTLGAVYEGSGLERVWCEINDAHGRARQVEMVEENGRYTGLWAGAEPGEYRVRARAVDVWGNAGEGSERPLHVAASEAGGPWVELGRPAGGIAPAPRYVVRAPSDPRVLYAGGSFGVWRSEDGGVSWEAVNHMGLATNGFFIFAFLLVDGADPFTLYTRREQNYRSRDGGQTWEPFGGGRFLSAMRAGSGGRLYALRGGGVERSDDYGDTWTEILEDAGGISGFRIDPQDENRLYAFRGRFGIADPGFLHISADGGKTWKRHDLPQPLEDIKVDPHNDGGLYGAYRDSLFYSADAGVSWTARSALGSGALRFEVDPLVPGRVFRWNLFRGFNYGISEDGGRTWRAQNLLVDGRQNFVGQWLPHPRERDRMLVVGNPFGGSAQPLVQSVDGGRTWAALDLGRGAPPLGAVELDGDGVLWVGAARDDPAVGITAGVLSSDDGGQTWGDADAAWVHNISGLPTELVFVDPLAPGRVIASWGSAWWRGTRGPGGRGLAWQPLLPGVHAFNPLMATDPRQEGVYYVTAGDEVWRSGDFGETWDLANGGLPDQGAILGLASGGDSGELWAAINSDLWRSRDQGRNWERAATVDDQYILHLADNPAAPGRLYAATVRGIYRSDDGGGTWALLDWPGSVSLARVRFRFAPGDPDRVLLVTGWHLYDSRDRGKSWERPSDLMPALPWVADAAVDPFDPEVLYAGRPTAVQGGPGGPAAFSLAPNYPNPFNPSTTIAYALPAPGRVRLTVYNLLGQPVRRLFEGARAAGHFSVQWDGRDDGGRPLASGVYLYRLEAGGKSLSRRMLLLK